jgi:hypothetical protein
MQSFPIHDDIEKTVESALENGITDVSRITGRLARYHTDPPSPETVREFVESKDIGKQSASDPEVDGPDGSISDEELRNALKSAGVNGEKAGEMPS